ncbi:nuclease-related domain-containing protein [Actinomadura sp. SCN-SB]|uniref:nuclease-related domain-containing protein n=1 Tax=Actinomadura sp. SCN-SB TaxID=3373092 RepID=UPI0037514235
MLRSGGRPGASGAGASAWSRYRALAAENRRERVVVRAVLSLGAGVVAAGLSMWWAGIAVAVGAFAGHTVYERVRPSPVTNWRRGAVAERRTGRRLAALDPAGFHVLHDRALPGTPVTNLDHLVVGLTGVYAIASRRWRRGVRLWTEGDQVWAGRGPAGNVRASAARAAAIVAELLGGELDYKIGVEAMVSVHGARPPRGGLRFGIGDDAVEFQPARALPRVISGRPVVITSAQVATIAAAAERALPPMIE